MLDLQFDDVVEAGTDEDTETSKELLYTIHNCEQNSPEWYQCRLGKITASDMQTLMGKGQTRNNLLLAKAAEIVTQTYDERRKFDTYDMRIGKELEPEAMENYEQITGNTVERVGFVELNPFVGCSPDAFANDDGLLEIKCPNNHNFLKQVIGDKSEITSMYMTQMQMQMWVCDRAWCDYAIYNPDFSPALRMMRIHRDEQEIHRIQEQVERAKQDIAHYIKQYNRNMELVK